MGQQALSVDFLSAKRLHRLRTSSMRDPLLRAIGLKPQQPLTVLDVTAGFGQDACLMAYHGAHVIMLEREPQMAALLQEGLIQAQTQGVLTQVTARLSLVIIDAKQYLLALDNDYPDVIYVDPMFVHRKKSALPNKQMQFLQQHCDDSDADELLILALRRARKRVVIKRSLNAPLLAELKPDLCIKSKLLRFDVFLLGG